MRRGGESGEQNREDGGVECRTSGTGRERREDHKTGAVTTSPTGCLHNCTVLVATWNWAIEKSIPDP